MSVLQKTLLSNCLSDTDSNSSRSVVMIVLERLTRAENGHEYRSEERRVGKEC